MTAGSLSGESSGERRAIAIRAPKPALQIAACLPHTGGHHCRGRHPTLALGLHGSGSRQGGHGGSAAGACFHSSTAGCCGGAVAPPPPPATALRPAPVAATAAAGVPSSSASLQLRGCRSWSSAQQQWRQWETAAAARRQLPAVGSGPGSGGSSGTGCSLCREQPSRRQQQPRPGGAGSCCQAQLASVYCRGVPKLREGGALSAHPAAAAGAHMCVHACLAERSCIALGQPTIAVLQGHNVQVAYRRDGPSLPRSLHPFVRRRCTASAPAGASCFPLCADNRCLLRLHVVYPRGGTSVGLKVGGLGGGRRKPAGSSVAGLSSS